MKKVFLYLYPIKEFADAFLVNDESCEKWYTPDSLLALNECINKRYRRKGYEIVYALFPDKELYGLDMYKGDKVIYTDISFEFFENYNKNSDDNPLSVTRYPSELYLLAQLDNIDELVVGGYHYSDSVKRVAEVALNNGINTLVDLDLTDLFFNLYKEKDYFDLENYDLNKFMEYMINIDGEKYQEHNKKQFIINYSSPVYGFNDISSKLK